MDKIGGFRRNYTIFKDNFPGYCDFIFFIAMCAFVMFISKHESR